MENGIFIGVASKGDGIPVDVIGMDKDKAVSELESQGYDVDLEPLTRPSSTWPRSPGRTRRPAPRWIPATA